MLLIGAAGNGGPCSDCVGYPAKYPEVMAVSSTDSNDDLSGSSSTGPEVEIAAPGTDIYSTYAGGGYATLSGTSMATPHVAGTGGHLMARGLSNDAARDDITITAEDLGLGSNESGAGLLDAHAAFDRRIPSVTTDGGAPGPGSITMHGELHDFGAGANSADVWFEWGFSSGNLLGATSKQSLSSPGQFSATVSGLRDGDTLYFKAVAEAADGDRDEGVVNLRTTLMPKH